MSPAFKIVKVAWVAGLGRTVLPQGSRWRRNLRGGWRRFGPDTGGILAHRRLCAGFTQPWKQPSQSYPLLSSKSSCFVSTTQGSEVIGVSSERDVKISGNSRKESQSVRHTPENVHKSSAHSSRPRRLTRRPDYLATPRQSFSGASSCGQERTLLRILVLKMEPTQQPSRSGEPWEKSYIHNIEYCFGSL